MLSKHETMSLLDEHDIHDLAGSLLARPGRLEEFHALMSHCPDLKPVARQLLCHDLDVGKLIVEDRPFRRLAALLDAVPEVHDSKNLLLLLADLGTIFILPAGAFHRLCDDKAVMLRAVALNGSALGFCSQRLLDDFDVVMQAAVGNEAWEALNHCSERLQDDEDIVRAVVQRTHLVLRWASPRLRDDDDIVATALLRDPGALSHASERLRADPRLQQLAEQVKRAAELAAA